MSLKQWLRNVVEYRLVGMISRLLWPPTSATALIEEDGEILALRFGDSYELPGGIVKAGETLKEGCRREVKEETGYDVEIGELLDVRTSHEGNGGHHFFFSAEITGGEESGSWEGEPTFVPKDEVQDRVWRLHHSHIEEYLFPEE